MSTLGELLHRDGLGLTSTSCGHESEDGTGVAYDVWRVTLWNRARHMTLDYRQGSGWDGERPKLVNVMECVVLDSRGAEESFEDWCGEMGLNSDSRKNERTWQACRAQAINLRDLLGDDKFEEYLTADA